MPKKVLLIEYEPRYIERIRTLLTPLGHTLTEAHDGEAGLQAFGTQQVRCRPPLGDAARGFRARR